MHPKLSKTVVTSKQNDNFTLIPCYEVHRELQEILLTIFAVLTTISFQKLLITVLSFSKQELKSHTLQTTAKKSHMENSMKVTLFNSLKSSFSGDRVLSYEY